PDPAGLGSWAHPVLDLHFVTHPESIEEVDFFSVPVRRPPTSPLFPYTTLFRSLGEAREDLDQRGARVAVGPRPARPPRPRRRVRSEEHTSELQSRFDLVCRLLLEKKKIRAHDPDLIVSTYPGVTAVLGELRRKG